METMNKQEIISKLLEYCGVPVRMVNARLGDGISQGSYFLTGDVGTGKTYKAVALLADYMVRTKMPYWTGSDGRIIPANVSPIFITAPELFLDIRSCFDKSGKTSETELISKYSDTPFLILDDLATEKVSEWSLQTLYIIINRRYDNPALTTIVTSNLSLDDLSVKFGDRITSRINGMCKTIRFKGQDRRMGK